jgi:predicted glycoside hydrolase/deacetylase ChbG (UPF0249 family)
LTARTTARIGAGPPVILCADDYGISEGVTVGIEELVAAGRLSATSAMVTFPEWPGFGRRLAALRNHVAIGLHLNLTVGSPLGPMPHLAPRGALPAVSRLVRGAWFVNAQEIEAEVLRQLERFTQHTGVPPDFVDGHQHAHALVGVRDGVLAALARFGGGGSLLVRDPADSLARIRARGLYRFKAAQIALFARGFGAAAQAAGCIVNDGFSGVSGFDPRVDYADEIEAGFTATGPRHLMMCHPGHADATLLARDGVTVRRQDEWSALLAAEGLEPRLWRPDRARANLWAPP